jgi:hypothetical protein
MWVFLVYFWLEGHQIRFLPIVLYVLTAVGTSFIGKQGPQKRLGRLGISRQVLGRLGPLVETSGWVSSEWFISWAFCDGLEALSTTLPS